MTPSKTTEYETRMVKKLKNEKKWQYVPRTETVQKTVMKTVKKLKNEVSWEMQPRIGKRTVMRPVKK